MIVFTDQTLESYKLTKNGKSSTKLQGIHSYDILANPYYADSFSYVSASVEDRHRYIIDGDSDEDNDEV